MMYVMYMAMVRKQLYIEEGQERAIKRRAKALGISEAEVVRAALDTALAAETVPAQPPLLDEDDPLEMVLSLAAEDARRGHRLPPGGYKREELYAEREERLVKRTSASHETARMKRR
jgi:hypothetical protein